MSSDLTARARIRDAAIELFAERGVEGATIRDIAQQADVSSGLLRHHFGSKEGLRDACDEWALHELTKVSGQFTEFSSLDGFTPRTRLLQSYLIRSILDGSPAGTAMFDRMLEFGESWLATTDLKVEDARAFVAALSVMKMSLFTMSDLMSRALGVDVTQREGWARMLRASLDVFSQPLITEAQALQARAAIDRIAAGEDAS
ncbi:TetR family transcriptional regulator [Paractinoplanes abujensis]|uniref:AcrR family transcriptional regulator n=1 Tax=Paractinoplanes abujensis TaxID=882441 RepID=A0A7W7CVT6_9ACTN|nr:TetR/AcrR family transcriptional regulator [Actinoplanes abujensis]MBB4695566.1 AcrR family transcriptional regulator [Actinoplanes abujensis]GID23150.1 TetR family transcriptional regulator [Actinoplanes abujensis]